MPRTLKAGSTWPPLRILIADDDGPVDLTNADSVELQATGPVSVLTGALTPDTGQADAPGDPHVTGRGWVEFDFEVGDTDDVGEYHTIVKVTWATGDIEWFPNTGADTLTVEAL